MKGRAVKYFIWVLLIFVWVGVAHALTPRLDNSSDFFAGEWGGAGEQGGYCYALLGADGGGIVLIDAGAGDWMGARIRWRNRRQDLQIDQIAPLPASPQQRLVPLETFVFTNGFNQSLELNWKEQGKGCRLQKIETTASHLNRARLTVQGLLSGKNSR